VLRIINAPDGTNGVRILEGDIRGARRLHFNK
jgi:hypothetical protein